MHPQLLQYPEKEEDVDRRHPSGVWGREFPRLRGKFDPRTITIYQPMRTAVHCYYPETLR
jgi:hypothetical protein